jgi:hypothetical protein
MKPYRAKEPQSRKARTSAPGAEPAAPGKGPVHSQPVSPCDDLQARIAKRAYEIHAERGYRYGYALDDWLEAERETLEAECNAS